MKINTESILFNFYHQKQTEKHKVQAWGSEEENDDRRAWGNESLLHNPW